MCLRRLSVLKEAWRQLRPHVIDDGRRGTLDGVREASILTILVLSFSAAASLLALPADEGCQASAIPQRAVLASEIDPGSWLTYLDAERGFGIRYPAGFRPAKVPSEHIAIGAVVTFIPTARPLPEDVGKKSNLVDVSVSIGVIDLPGANHVGLARLAISHLTSSAGDPCYEAGSLHFVKSYSAEGAVGNRYETTSYCTHYSGKRYEICLFLHTVNPGVYEPGCVTVFDPGVLVGLLEGMVRTFFPAGQISHPD